MLQLLQVEHHAGKGTLHLVQGGLVHIVVEKQIFQLVRELHSLAGDVDKFLKVAAVLCGAEDVYKRQIKGKPFFR